MSELTVTNGRGRVTKALVVAAAVAATALACSSSSSGGGQSTGAQDGGTSSDASGATRDGGANDCTDFSGTYDVTTEVVATDCSLGLHAISQPVRWKFLQTAPSCDFHMNNSLYPDCVYTGYFTMTGTQAKITWTQVVPAPLVAGRTLTYTSEDLTIAAGADGGGGILSGTFAWGSSAPCTGTTNVCHGSVPAGCPTPN